MSQPHGSIRWTAIVDIALKNLFYKRLRTSLTILGVVIGVGAVVFLLAFGFGLRDVVTKQVVDSNSIRTVDIESAKSQLITLNERTVSQIRDVAHVEELSRIYSVPASTSYNNSSTESVLYAVDKVYLKLVSPKVAAGKPLRFTDDGQVFINTSYAKLIGQDNYQKLLGQKLTVSFKAPLTTDNEGNTTQSQPIAHTGNIAGVLETGNGAEIYISSNVITAKGGANASQVKVLVDKKENVPNVQKNIEALGLVTNSPLSTLEQINQVFVFLNLLFLAFGGIGLIIATLGMLNTLTISLLERTREIGLMITLGARRRDIRRMFLVEALGLALIGGIIGLFVAFIMSTLANIVLNNFARSRGVSETFSVFTYTPQMIFVVLLFSSILGILVVYYPAKRAADTNPIDALRS